MRELVSQFVNNSVGRKICRNTHRLFPPPFDWPRMNDWIPKLKAYPHFDKHLPEEEILRIVTDPKAVAQNSFYPFMLFHEERPKFGGKKQERGNKPRPKGKPRPIRYAARRDSYIYSYYRHLLSLRYEDRLSELGLSDHVIAYRKIPVKTGSKSGKCNIHFARDAFIEIRNRGECYAIALDISDFFGNINHVKLEAHWCDLMGFSQLPSDHAAVFKAITKYADVDYRQALERLGYWGPVTIKGVEKMGYLRARKTIPMQLCSPKVFREKICGGNTQYPKLIMKDKERVCGIPQGSPMSDLLANLYLLNFDHAMHLLATEVGAYYRRYSDDILIVCQKDEGTLHRIMASVKEEIKKAGEELRIADNKTIIKEFSQNPYPDCRYYDHPDYPEQAVAPLRNRSFEYLGFSYDGNIVKLKDTTVSRYYRKMTLGIRREARELVERYNNKSPDDLLKLAKVSKIYQKYGKIDDFEEHSDDPKKWNFWTYALRSVKIMGPCFDNRIFSQVKRHKKRVISLLETEIKSAHAKKPVRFDPLPNEAS